MLIDDANEMHDYDFYDDYPPAIIYGIIMMIITLTRSTDAALGLLSQSGLCFLVTFEAGWCAPVYPCVSNTVKEAAFRPNAMDIPAFSVYLSLGPFVSAAASNEKHAAAKKRCSRQSHLPAIKHRRKQSELHSLASYCGFCYVD